MLMSPAEAVLAFIAHVYPALRAGLMNSAPAGVSDVLLYAPMITRRMTPNTLMSTQPSDDYASMSQAREPMQS